MQDTRVGTTDLCTWELPIIGPIENLAESEGFEPSIPVKVCRFSRPVPSTARPTLRLIQFYYTQHIKVDAKRVAKAEGGQIKEAAHLNRGDRRKRPSSREETTCLEQSPTVLLK